MNVVGVLHFPSEYESEPKVLVKVVIRAQAKENAKGQANEKKDQQSKQEKTPSASVKIGRKSWKAKQEKAKSKYEQTQVTLVAKISQVEEELKQHRENKSSIMEPNKAPKAISSQGSILVDKVLEPLNAVFEAYEDRLKPKQTLEERQMTYTYKPAGVLQGSKALLAKREHCGLCRDSLKSSPL
ncbi:hypothetical protein L7F22_024240 [Adiantum nelumboides]|nr:hypothetical protein [Adiantum nelumboides]